MSDKSVLEINVNEEYKIKIENGNQFDDSIFKDVYDEALKNVIEIIRHYDSHKDSKYDDFNNIIAFTGERGKGKSSSMISFRDALVGFKNEKKHFDFFKGKIEIENNHFATIDIIDPSLFRGDESLFEIILAKMFHHFHTELKNKNSKINDEDRRIIIGQFQKVFENLQIINSDRKELYKKESIEALSKIATSSNLRVAFKELVSVYLEKFEKNKNFLIIAIDDFDLNISNAYDMLEDIRQFLIQSNIILLIACKIEQLEDSIINKLTKEYKELKEHQSLEKIKYAASKYLEKIFPQHRIIILPELLVKDKLSIFFVGNNNDLNNVQLLDILDNKNSQLKENLIQKKELFIGINPQNAISVALYKKSGLFINSPSLRRNSFYPDNFRSILNLLSILKKNSILDELIRYTVDIARKNLSSDFAEVFTSLENQSIETLNLGVVNCISNLKYNFNELYSNYILFATNPLNVNIGDVYTVLYAINNQLSYTNKNQILFVDLLNVYYSLRLLQCKSFDSNIFSFFNATSIHVFRKTSTGKYRDYIFFDKVPIKRIFDEILSVDDKIWFLHFFANFGKFNAKYRDESESPYFKSYLGVNQGLFSPLAIFSNILFPEKLADQINLKNYGEVQLYKEISDWNQDTENLNNLFKNPMFYLELMSVFEKESSVAHKSDGIDKTEEGEEIYFNTLYVYFTQSFEKALSVMSIKYPFLNIDAVTWVNKHPILKHWKTIYEDDSRKKQFQDTFQIIFRNQGEIRFSQGEIDLASKILEDYDAYFKNDQSNNSRGAKQAMNTVVKQFVRNKEIHSQLENHRRYMNTNLKDGLSRIEELLKFVKNG